MSVSVAKMMSERGDAGAEFTEIWLRCATWRYCRFSTLRSA
ncbi:MAG: hypothetical protein JWR24_4522 [Actinoallomurus sp.]|jgi:hypothetical protein|nr:hypothetical protein [Actinoallomurus sp.]